MKWKATLAQNTVPTGSCSTLYTMATHDLINEKPLLKVRKAAWAIPERTRTCEGVSASSSCWSAIFWLGYCPLLSQFFRDSGVSKSPKQQQLRQRAFPFSRQVSDVGSVLGASLENTATTKRSLQFWLRITQRIEAKNCDAYSWAQGQTYNAVCQPEGVTPVFTQILCWQLTGFWPRRVQHPPVRTTGLKTRSPVNCIWFIFPPVFKGRGIRPWGRWPMWRIALSPSPVLRGDLRMDSPPGDLWAG